jgi:hypothetical protein
MIDRLFCTYSSKKLRRFWEYLVWSIDANTVALSRLLEQSSPHVLVHLLDNQVRSSWILE